MALISRRRGYFFFVKKASKDAIIKGRSRLAVFLVHFIKFLKSDRCGHKISCLIGTNHIKLFKVINCIYIYIYCAHRYAFVCLCSVYLYVYVPCIYIYIYMCVFVFSIHELMCVRVCVCWCDNFTD